MQPTQTSFITAPRAAPPPTQLRFSPYAWAKLRYLRDIGNTEVSVFGIASVEGPLCIEDLELAKQTCSVASIRFDDDSVADFFDRQVDLGRKPEQFARIWIHTHPGSSPNPSFVDEDTFARVYGRCDWAVMCILAQGDQTYARLRFNVGPGGTVIIPVVTDFSLPFSGSDHQQWRAEYDANVFPELEWPIEPNPYERGYSQQYWQPRRRGKKKKTKLFVQSDDQLLEEMGRNFLRKEGFDQYGQPFDDADFDEGLWSEDELGHFDPWGDKDAEETADKLVTAVINDLTASDCKQSPNSEENL